MGWGGVGWASFVGAQQQAPDASEQRYTSQVFSTWCRSMLRSLRNLTPIALSTHPTVILQDDSQ